ncbi:MAG: PQQ-binding-like beta-propeller repeat protein [Verrucomicrobia bacterium]|nr:PQQ-binding-like beta-propeller repeat protein [Verrucomicrobiota bacterium]
MKRRLSIFILLVCASSCSALADNWARFRGPNGTGISNGDTSRVPLKWSDKENLKWKTELPGPGSSSPIVWGDRVYVTCYTGYGDGSGGGSPGDVKRHLIALTRKDGKVLWSKVIAAEAAIEDPYKSFVTRHGYASNTPVTDGERIYCFFGKPGVFAFDWDGKPLWQQSVYKLESSRRWGSASSPILHAGKVIVKAGDEALTVYAFDAQSGKKLWEIEDKALDQNYGTPVLHRVDENRSDLILAVNGKMSGIDPATGKSRWFSKMGLTGGLTSSPLVFGDHVVLLGGFPKTKGTAFKLGMTGDVSDTAPLWENSKVKTYLTTPVYHDGYLYYIREEGIACCADPLTGKLIYAERIEGAASGSTGKGNPFYASPVLVNGHLVVVSRTAGTFIIEAKPKYKLVRVNKVDGDKSRFQGTPAVGDGQIFLRSDDAVYCFGGVE